VKIGGTAYRTIWADGATVQVIDQTKLPFTFEVRRLRTLEDAAHAIRTMIVRGAPLIGATAAYGIALAMLKDPSDANLNAASETLRRTRPTAVNLAWALAEMRGVLAPLPADSRRDAAFTHAAAICDADVTQCAAIGDHGRAVLEQRWRALGKPARLNVLTHCNAGWLACVDWGTALAPIYKAHDTGIPVHVWVDETRPRNQGAALTAYELGAHGVPHTLIADNTGGHLMQRGAVDICIVGSDRTTSTGDVCNKIGTYLKALAAHAHDVPFYVALPSSTVDWTMTDGTRIPIEERDPTEVTYMTGVDEAGQVSRVRIAPETTQALNIAFDVTPARYVAGLITERGVCAASRDGLLGLFPERAREAVA
jgi:methylthioribose-1-phosphate isomerase